MSRQLRVYYPGAWYHVMNRGINHHKIFFNDLCKKTFLEVINKTINIYGIEIHAYCLMDNHYHLIIHTPRANISDAMKYMNSNYARFVNVTMNRDGPLFKGRFKSIIVSDDEYLIQLSRYIHLNPLKAQMVKKLEAYKWSSYQFYLNEKKKPEWLVTNEIINRFGRNNFSKTYKKYVESDTNPNTENFYNEIKLSPVYSNEELRYAIHRHIKKQSLSAEIVGSDRILILPSIHEIIKIVATHYQIDLRIIYERSVFRMNEARRVAIYICREFGGYSLKKIGEEMGNVNYKTIASSIGRVKSDNSQLKIAEGIMEKMRNTVPRLIDLELK